MRDRGDSPSVARRWFATGEFALYGLIVGAVFLGWQIVLQPLVQRAPVEAAVRLAPGSPIALGRAAEFELSAGRTDNAAELGRAALARSPFDIRALRVIGLTEAEAGREDRADELLTLAGNWSLRDDPSHAWLVQRRLREGDYASAFAHADTLVRRREDIQPEVFRLFALAGTVDAQRSLPVLAQLLIARPPWRTAFLNGLNGSPEQLQVATRLAVLLEPTSAPLNQFELQTLYWTLLDKGQFEALKTLRRLLGRPSAAGLVTNGEFSDASAPQPFQWRLNNQAGIAGEVVADDLRPSNVALRVDYDGYATGVVVEQLTTLAPGAYRLTSNIRKETGEQGARLAWTLYCVPGGEPVASVAADAQALETWSNLSGMFEISPSCPVQWLRIETRPGDRRSRTVVWFDRVAILAAK